MSWVTEWREAGRIRVPKKYNSLPDIKKALREEFTDEDFRRAATYVNRMVDLPGMSEAQEEELILSVLTIGVQMLLGE